MNSPEQEALLEYLKLVAAALLSSADDRAKMHQELTQFIEEHTDDN